MSFVHLVVFLACIPLLVACSDDRLIRSPASRMSEPFGLTASDDHVGHVRLDWSLPPESLEHKLRVERDGVEIAVLEGGVEHFLDTTAAAGEARILPPSLDATPAWVELRWAGPTVREGARHSYRIAADYGWGVLRRSSPAIGGRRSPSIGAYRILRDGEVLATLPSEVRAYRDAAAPPGAGLPSQLELTPGVLSILLRWQPAPTTPGDVASYSVVALTEVGPFPTEEARGGRAAPTLEGYRILRDGEAIASLPPTATSFDDVDAQPGVLGPPPAPEATRHLDAVELRWEEPVSRPGKSHRYVLETQLSSQTLRSEPRRGRRDAPTVLDYHVVRDGIEFNVEEVPFFFYFDGAPGTVGAPLEISATQGSRSDGIGVSWSAPPSAEGAPNDWAVRVHSELGISESSPGVLAGRGSPALLRYEIRRDGGAWRRVGLESSFEDADAPEGSIVAVATAEVDEVLGLVELDLEEAPATAAGEPVIYEVRAITEWGPGPISSSVTGFRGTRPIAGLAFQWQRSGADEDSDYVDLPGATEAGAIDRTAPLDEGRYYRIRYEGVGVSGFSAGVRAMPQSYLEVSAGGRHSCGLRIDGRIRCWGDDSEGQASPPDPGPFSSISTGEAHSCAIRIDGEKRICWGSARQTEVGGDHGCGIRADGTLECWGDDALAPPGGRFEAVSTGGGHACGLREDGRIDCWGRNDEGQAPRQP